MDKVLRPCKGTHSAALQHAEKFICVAAALNLKYLGNQTSSVGIVCNIADMPKTKTDNTPDLSGEKFGRCLNMCLCVII